MEPKKRQRESLGLYKSFNNLWVETMIVYGYVYKPNHVHEALLFSLFFAFLCFVYKFSILVEYGSGKETLENKRLVQTFIDF